MHHLPHLVVFFLFAVQAIGLLSAALARICLGSPFQKPAQWLFFTALPLVGALVIVSLGFGPGCWLTSGTTLALMILTVTCDFEPNRRFASR